MIWRGYGILIWQHKAHFCLESFGRGVAIREIPLRTGFADYLLFAGRRAVGAIKAKAVGLPLSGVEIESKSTVLI